jgi:hypothetical protein
LLPAAIAVASLGAARDAAAGDKRAGKTYYFLLWKVTLADGVPAGIAAQVETQARKAIEAHPQLVGVLPDDAPDPKANPKAFKRYITRHRIRPYRVNIEVTSYEQEVEPMPAPRRGNRITVSVALRTFGETMPMPSMAFAGEGSATIKMEVGKRIRDRDRQIANQESLELAVDKALATSIVRLEAKAKSQAKPKRKRRRPRKK